jgi:hypothetical protein
VRAPGLVLTAAHCVQPGADYKIVQYGADKTPHLQDVKSVAIHPGFRMEAMIAHRATADVALLRLTSPAKGKTPASLGVPQLPIAVGGKFTIAGVGVTVRGDGKSAGTSAARHWSRPASPARCRFAWSIRRRWARAKACAPAPEIQARRCSRINRMAPQL